MYMTPATFLLTIFKHNIVLTVVVQVLLFEQHWFQGCPISHLILKHGSKPSTVCHLKLPSQKLNLFIKILPLKGLKDPG